MFIAKFNTKYNIMIKDKFISITDIRKNASSYISNIKKTWNKIIFVNNKPKAMLIDIDEYEKLIAKKIDLKFEPIKWSEEILTEEEHTNFIDLLRNA